MRVLALLIWSTLPLSLGTVGAVSQPRDERTVAELAPEMRKSMMAELRRILESYRSEYEIARARADSLENALELMPPGGR